jgi:phosphate/sulfate permease
MVLGFLLMTAICGSSGGRRPRASTAGSAGCSCVGGAYSLGHGANDAQKTMGIIAGVLFAGGYI